MKKIGLIILMAFSLSFVYSLDTTVPNEIDSAQTENVVTENTNDSEVLDANAEKNAEYFMYGFLVLGAFLVFWKFKNNK